MAGGLLWRIARRPYALDRQGIGARENGGRWNFVGTSVIYTGRTVGISALEKFVQLAGVVPPDLVLVRVTLPDNYSFEEPAIGDLPLDWNVIPAAPSSMEFGTKWAQESRSLVLYVPSVLAPEERVGVVNPNHPEFAGVTIAIERDFHYDPRMFNPRVAPTRV